MQTSDLVLPGCLVSVQTLDWQLPSQSPVKFSNHFQEMDRLFQKQSPMVIGTVGIVDTHLPSCNWFPCKPCQRFDTNYDFKEIAS